MNRRFWKYFGIALIGQPVVLYALMILGIGAIWNIFYDPLFSWIAKRVKVGFNVIAIFLLVLGVFSAYAAFISGALILFSRWRHGEGDRESRRLQ